MGFSLRDFGVSGNRTLWKVPTCADSWVSCPGAEGLDSGPWGVGADSAVRIPMGSVVVHFFVFFIFRIL